MGKGASLAVTGASTAGEGAAPSAVGGTVSCPGITGKASVGEPTTGGGPTSGFEDPLASPQAPPMIELARDARRVAARTDRADSLRIGGSLSRCKMMAPDQGRSDRAGQAETGGRGCRLGSMYRRQRTRRRTRSVRSLLEYPASGQNGRDVIDRGVASRQHRGLRCIRRHGRILEDGRWRKKRHFRVTLSRRRNADEFSCQRRRVAVSIPGCSFRIPKETLLGKYSWRGTCSEGI
jgi:hypothetical protein